MVACDNDDMGSALSGDLYSFNDKDVLSHAVSVGHNIDYLCGDKKLDRWVVRGYEFEGD